MQDSAPDGPESKLDRNSIKPSSIRLKESDALPGQRGPTDAARKTSPAFHLDEPGRRERAGVRPLPTIREPEPRVRRHGVLDLEAEIAQAKKASAEYARKWEELDKKQSEFKRRAESAERELMRLRESGDELQAQLTRAELALKEPPPVLPVARTMSATHAEKSTVSAGRMNAVSSGQESGGTAAMSALDAAAAAAKLQMASGPATDIKFCGVDDPTCESCQ